MMKQVNIKLPFRMLALIVGLFLSMGAFAQINVKGHVKDATGEAISVLLFAWSVQRSQR